MSSEGSCPECDASVVFSSSPHLGMRTICPNCRAKLVLIGIHPIDLDWAFEEPLGTGNELYESDWLMAHNQS